MEIVDTVYLVAYFKQTDPLHDNAVNVVENLGKERRVSEAALLELDLLMKARGFTEGERRAVWSLLSRVIDVNSVEPVYPLDFCVAVYLSEKYSLEYFDSLVAAQCIVRNAIPLTTDSEIKEVFIQRGKVLEELKRERTCFIF